MATSDVLATISVVLSLSAVVTSALVARAQAALANRERLLPIVSELLRDSLTAEYRASRVYIENELQPENPDPDAGLRGLTAAGRERVRPVMGYFNNMGLLVANGTVPAEVVASTMGGTVVRSWQALAPYVYAERRFRGDDPIYYRYFEHLAAVVKEIGRRGLDDLLQLRTWPPE